MKTTVKIVIAALGLTLAGPSFAQPLGNGDKGGNGKEQKALEEELGVAEVYKTLVQRTITVLVSGQRIETHFYDDGSNTTTISQGAPTTPGSLKHQEWVLRNGEFVMTVNQTY